VRVIEVHDTIQEEEDSSTDLCIRLAFYVCMLFKTLLFRYGPVCDCHIQCNEFWYCANANNGV